MICTVIETRSAWEYHHIYDFCSETKKGWLLLLNKNNEIVGLSVTVHVRKFCSNMS